MRFSALGQSFHTVCAQNRLSPGPPCHSSDVQKTTLTYNNFRYPNCPLILKSRYWFTLIRAVSTRAMSGSRSWNHTPWKAAWVVAVTAMTTRLLKAFSSYWNANGLRKGSTERETKPEAIFLIISKCFITVSVGMVRASRCHRLNMKTYIINGPEVSRLYVPIQTARLN